MYMCSCLLEASCRTYSSTTLRHQNPLIQEYSFYYFGLLLTNFGTFLKNLPGVLESLGTGHGRLDGLEAPPERAEAGRVAGAQRQAKQLGDQHLVVEDLGALGFYGFCRFPLRGFRVPFKGALGSKV